MKLTAFVEGLGVGILSTYLLDPHRGGQRRALLKDKVVHQTLRKRDAVQVMCRDFVNRSKGIRYRVRRRFDHVGVGDEVLLGRVRAELGRYVSHFHAIDVTCENGVITLAGPILASEIQDCVWHARMVPGVKHVVNSLHPHASAENIPELQGGVQAIMQHKWNPATSLVMGIAGVLFTAYGMGRRGAMGTALQVVGVGMLAKAFHDTEHRFDPSARRHASLNGAVGGRGQGHPSDMASLQGTTPPT
jgi:hypothetical protein